jgi:hypothetical protein
MPLVGSPVINTGNPAFNTANPDGLSTTNDATPYDQRGATFNRIYGGRIDKGAVERQPIPAVVVGDFNQNGTVEAGDYITWRKTLGATVAPFTGADASGNGIIDQADYAIWRAHYGFVIPLIESSGAGVGSSQLLVAQSVPDIANNQPAPAVGQAVPDSSSAHKPLRSMLPTRLPTPLSFDSATLNLIALRSPAIAEPTATGMTDPSDSQSSDPDSHHCDALDAAFAALVVGFTRSRV